jgi:molybdopterin molybdotransferase
MDGFAVSSRDTISDGKTVGLRVMHEIPAGALDPGSIRAGEAARIMTGAPMPAGADTVVPFEETSTDDGIVTLASGLVTGACVRPVGLDIKPGDVVLERGTRIGPRQIALAASIGVSELSVFRRPTVAILTTGDELVEPGTPLRPGQIYNSNAHGLAAAVRELGAIPRVCKPARDDPDALREILSSLTDADLILTSGGVSVGDFDYVKQVMETIGEVEFWRIRMRPGKPLMLGWLPSSSPASGRTMMIGLPGNPTSTMVTFFVIAQPVILRLMGHADPVPQPLHATTLDALDNRGGRETYFRVRVQTKQSRLLAHLSGAQDSSMLLPLSRANGLARVPADVERIEPGEGVDVFLL